MNREADNKWMDMNLSELVEKSLGLGVIPIFRFLDKDKVAVSGEPTKPMTERTPIDVLRVEIWHYKNFITKIETRDGIHIPEDKKEETEQRLSQLVVDLNNKIIEFELAITALLLHN